MAYSNDIRPLIIRLREYQGLTDEQFVDKEGLLIENFELANNLMFGHIVIANNAEQAIRKLVQ